ncbi:hypothetical protein DESA109040_21960 [Deinococcus saxicola]|uniref:hypothetical protein n=1 Tax=Deinococcus saxicola TaxID=249406 RepID=UPI0039EF18A3
MKILERLKIWAKYLGIALVLLAVLASAALYYTFNLLGATNFSSVDDADSVSMLDCLQREKINYRIKDKRIEISFPNLAKVEERCPIQIVPGR